MDKLTLYVGQAFDLMHQGEWARAIRKLSEAISLDPTNFALHSYLADCYLFIGDQAAAESAFVASEELAPLPKENLIRIWNLQSGKKIRTPLRGHRDGVMSLALQGDGKRLFSGSYDRTIKVWDVAKGSELLTLRGHPGSVGRLALCSDSKRLFSGGSWCRHWDTHDSSIKMWDAEAGKEILTLRGPARESDVNALALSWDGKWLYSSYEHDDDMVIKDWDLQAGEKRCILCGHTGPVRALALSGDGKRLVFRRK